MFLLSNPQKLLVVLFVVTTMLSIGLRTRIDELLGAFRARSLLVRALVANLVLVPLVGFALARLVPLAPATAGAIILLACVPGGLSTIQFISKVKGQEALAETLFILLTVIAVLISPILAGLALPEGTEFRLPVARAPGFILLSTLVPLGFGIFVCGRWPAMAAKLSKGLAFVSLVLFIAFTVAIKSYRKQALASLGGAAIGVMAALIATSMAIGWLMGGPTRQSRQILATVTSMRNAALCLMIARNSPGGDAVLMPLIGFSLLMVPPNTILTLYGSLAARRAAASKGRVKQGRAS